MVTDFNFPLSTTPFVFLRDTFRSKLLFSVVPWISIKMKGFITNEYYQITDNVEVNELNLGLL